MKPLHAIRTPLAVVLALWSALVFAADTEMQIFDLKHRPADQIAPIVQPLLREGEVVQAHGFELIVRAAPATIEQVRALLDRLDRAPKRLLISVRQSSSGRTAEGGAEAQVRTRPGDSAGSIRLYGTNGREQGAAEQQIQVLEGNPAFIAFGQSVPVGERTLVIGPGGGAVQDSIRYRDVTSGFYVLPQLRDKRVRLRISPHRETLSRSGGGVVNLQRADTVVEGPLGEWIELGGTVEQRSNDQAGIVYGTRARTEQQGRIAVKVDVLP